MYSLIVCSELITFPCIKLISFIYVLESQILWYVFIIKTHSVLCLLLSY